MPDADAGFPPYSWRGWRTPVDGGVGVCPEPKQFLVFGPCLPHVSAIAQARELQPGEGADRILRRSAHIDAQLARAIEDLTTQAQTCDALLSDVLASAPLNRQEPFTFVRRLCNYEEWKADAAPPTCDADLDYFVADSTLECHRTCASRLLRQGAHNDLLRWSRTMPSAHGNDCSRDPQVLYGRLRLSRRLQPLAGQRLVPSSMTWSRPALTHRPQLHS